MKNNERDRYLTRERVLKLLSDDEVARVSTAESATRLERGDDYLDLDALDRGVQRSAAVDATPMAKVLPRKAVRTDTWLEILRELARGKIAAPHSGGRTDDSY